MRLEEAYARSKDRRGGEEQLSAELRKSRDGAFQILGKACDQGVDVACEQRDALPTLDELTWRPDGETTSK